MASWTKGMVLDSRARGPGFESGTGRFQKNIIKIFLRLRFIIKILMLSYGYGKLIRLIETYKKKKK